MERHTGRKVEAGSEVIWAYRSPRWSCLLEYEDLRRGHGRAGRQTDPACTTHVTCAETRNSWTISCIPVDCFCSMSGPSYGGPMNGQWWHHRTNNAIQPPAFDQSRSHWSQPQTIQASSTASAYDRGGFSARAPPTTRVMLRRSQSQQSIARVC